jgi:hypothetical protein
MRQQRDRGIVPGSGIGLSRSGRFRARGGHHGTPNYFCRVANWTSWVWCDAHHWPTRRPADFGEESVSGVTEIAGGTDGLWTLRWRRESAANSFSEIPNSLLAGKIQGISPIRGLSALARQRKRARNQFLASQFPTHPNRKFFAVLQGIKSGDQGSFVSVHLWHGLL